MKFFANKNYTFYPDIQGNLALPENERLAIEVIRPTTEERGDLTYTEVLKGDSDAAKVRQSFNVPRILTHHVGKITNLVVASGDEEKTISTGAELASASFYGSRYLVDAICLEVCSDMPTDSEKKT